MLARHNRFGSVDPFLGALSPLRELQQTMDSLFDEFYRSSFAGASNRGRGGLGSSLLMPPINMYRKGQEVVVECALPGVRKEDIDISLQDNTLVIRGEIKPLHQRGQGGSGLTSPVEGPGVESVKKPLADEQTSGQASTGLASSSSSVPEVRDEHFLHREVQYGSFERVIGLPEEIKPDSVQARFEDGILRLTMLPLEVQSPKQRQIPIL